MRNSSLVEESGVAQGGGVQGKLVAHAAILVEVAQLPPEVVLGDVRAAHVVAKAHRDASRVRNLKYLVQT